VLESLHASSGAFSIGMKNGFAVASKIINTLVENWDAYGSSTPKI
jgi:purine nucleoside permease